jgi:tol-pal system protein YbgF
MGTLAALSMFAPPLKTLLVLATWLLGCATSRSASSEAELVTTVTSLRAQNNAYVRRLEELENRVFVLQAELDSRRAGAGERVAEPAPSRPPPLLPETKLEPGEQTPEPEPALGPTSLVDETLVEYAGAAAEEGPGKRPLLRLWGPGELPPEASPPEVSPPRSVRAAAASAVQTGHGGEVALYQSALESLRAGAHGEAVAAFRAFVKRHPGHEYADNAQYWLGESFYHRKDYSMALREFRRVVEKFPRGNKVPDALLKLGFSYLALGSTRPGREALHELARSYPRHPASGLAAAKLAELADRSGEKEER